MYIYISYQLVLLRLIGRSSFCSYCSLLRALEPLLISPHMRWVVKARNMSINRSAVSAIVRAIFSGKSDLQYQTNFVARRCDRGFKMGYMPNPTTTSTINFLSTTMLNNINSTRSQGSWWAKPIFRYFLYFVLLFLTKT